jgi:hypothetical protein
VIDGNGACTCRNNPSWSAVVQCSTTTPFATRWMFIPVIVTRFPVGGAPRNSP